MREWIVTNGLGGYASLTHNNTNSRKFHGLLVASLDPPSNRWIFVSNVTERVQIGDQEFDLADQKSRYSFDIFPSFLYSLKGVEIRKTIFMPYTANTTIITYDIKTPVPLSIFHSPLVTSRHFYDVNNNNAFSLDIKNRDDGIESIPSNSDRKLKIILKNSSFSGNESRLALQFNKDRERHDSWVDHVLKVGEFKKSLTQSNRYYLVFTIEEEGPIDTASLYEKEVMRKKKLIQQANLPEHLSKLVLNGDNFLVKKGQGRSIVAGYHWFSDWGRDAMIALPGLTLVTRRFHEAQQILDSFGSYCQNGLIPNMFIDRNSEAMYNTVDASLWFIDRVYQYLKYTDDKEFLERTWSILHSIMNGYQHGTDYGIYMDHDSLISHGDGLTWMDVKIGSYYPTPRSKKAVEIQALWYNALMIMGTLASILGKDDPYTRIAEEVKERFTAQYDKYYDVIDKKDVSLRPNQIFLVSLDYTMINHSMQEQIVETIQNKLHTIFGLRSLSNDHPLYKGTYLGDYNKDIAYHNGTVWSWLLGPFITAFVRVHHYEEKWRKYAYKTFLQPMLDVFGENWDGSIPEIFDGDPPFLPRGCMTQAWSVAEVLRTWVEDIERITPPYVGKYYMK